MGKGLSSIESQAVKLFKHTRSGSYGTRDRYKHSCLNFAKFVSDRFKVQNLRNLQDKHVAAYVQHRLQEGISANTIKNDLAAVRYMHDLVPDARHQLSDNKDLQSKFEMQLESTPAVKGDRAWTDQEYQSMQELAQQTGNRDLSDVMTLCRSMGLRITEACAVRRSQAEAALRTGTYQVQGEAKNGKHREVPLSAEAKGVFESRLKKLDRGQRLFVRPNEKLHQTANRLEKSLGYYRDQVRTEEGELQRTYEIHGRVETNDLTFHGLRYGYVQDRMKEEMGRGLTWEQAADIVTQEVGHNRTDVIEIYTAGR